MAGERDVSVVIPTFEEAETIATVVEALRDVLGRWDWEIVIVDDSPDRSTVDVLDERYAADARVRWNYRQGSGLASAVLRGFELATGDVYVVLDADLQHPPRRVHNLLAGIDRGADVAVGSRHAPGGGIDGDWPAHRRVISAGATALAKIAIPTARGLSDPMSGFFAIRAGLVDAAPTLRPHGYKILLELLARCPVKDVAEIPYHFQERDAGSSNLGMREYLRYLRHLATLIVPSRLSSGPRPETEVVEL